MSGDVNGRERASFGGRRPWRRVVAVGLLCGAAAGAAGWCAAAPVYRAIGVIELPASPLPPTLEELGGCAFRWEFPPQPVPRMSSAHAASACALVRTSRVFAAAAGSPELRDSGISVADLDDGMQVRALPRTTWLTVSFDHTDPATASAAVNAVLDACPSAVAAEDEAPLLRPAPVPFRPVHDRRAAFASLGALLGVALAAGASYALQKRG